MDFIVTLYPFPVLEGVLCGSIENRLFNQILCIWQHVLPTGKAAPKNHTSGNESLSQFLLPDQPLLSLQTTLILEMAAVRSLSDVKVGASGINLNDYCFLFAGSKGLER